MSTLTKEWLLKTIAELEEERDAVPGAVNEDAAMALAAMKLALASIESEPVAFRSKLKPPSAIGSEHWDYKDHRQPDAFELESCVIERLFTEPPAPVAVPEWTNEQCLEFLSIAFRHAEIKGDLELDDIRLGVKMVNGSRAAMLQGAEPVTTAYKLPPHIFRELVNRLRDTAVKYQGCQQLREQLSRTLQEVIQPAAPQQEA